MVVSLAANRVVAKERDHPVRRQGHNHPVPRQVLLVAARAVAFPERLLVPLRGRNHLID